MNILKQTWTLVLYEQEFFLDEEIILQNEEFHYIVTVLRLKINDSIELSNAIGTKAFGFISVISKKTCTIKITEVTHCEAPKRKVHLVLAYLKPTALEEAVFVASELGVSQIHLFRSERAASKQSIKLDKLQKISNEAIRISKSAYSAKVFQYENLDDCFVNLSSSCFLFCDESRLYSESLHGEVMAEREDLPDIVNFRLKPQFDNICVVVGPEASFSLSERNRILQMDNCYSVSLGNHILKSTTAVTCACFAACAISSD